MLYGVGRYFLLVNVCSAMALFVVALGGFEYMCVTLGFLSHTVLSVIQINTYHYDHHFSWSWLKVQVVV